MIRGIRGWLQLWWDAGPTSEVSAWQPWCCYQHPIRGSPGGTAGSGSSMLCSSRESHNSHMMALSTAARGKGPSNSGKHSGRQTWGRLVFVPLGASRTLSRSRREHKESVAHVTFRPARPGGCSQPGALATSQELWASGVLCQPSGECPGSGQGLTGWWHHQEEALQRCSLLALLQLCSRACCWSPVPSVTDLGVLGGGVAA